MSTGSVEVKLRRIDDRVRHLNAVRIHNLFNRSFGAKMLLSLLFRTITAVTDKNNAQDTLRGSSLTFFSSYFNRLVDDLDAADRIVKNSIQNCVFANSKAIRKSSQRTKERRQNRNEEDNVEVREVSGRNLNSLQLNVLHLVLLDKKIILDVKRRRVSAGVFNDNLDTVARVSGRQIIRHKSRGHSLVTTTKKHQTTDNYAYR